MKTSSNSNARIQHQALKQLNRLGYKQNEYIQLCVINHKSGAVRHLERLLNKFDPRRLAPSKESSLLLRPNGGPSDKHVNYCRNLIVEFDGISKEDQRKIWDKCGLPPASLIVDGGNKSLHFFITYNEPVNPESHRELGKDIAAWLGSDPNLANPSTLCRLAGFKHPKSGKEAEIVFDSGKQYSFDEIRAVVPPRPKTEKHCSLKDEAPIYKTLREQIYPKRLLSQWFGSKNNGGFEHRFKGNSEQKRRGCCPWHESTTRTAFYIERKSNGKIMFGCSTCKEYGDLIDYYMYTVGLNHIEAIKYAFNVVGIEPPDISAEDLSSSVPSSMKGDDNDSQRTGEAPPAPLETLHGIFPDEIAAILDCFAEDANIPKDWLLLVVLVAVSGTVGYRLRIAPTATWRNIMQVQMLIVAPSGSRKSVAIAFEIDLLEALDRIRRDEYESALDEWEKEKRTAEEVGEEFETPKPERRHTYVVDSTPEKTDELHQGTYGLAQVNHEADTYYSGIDSYNSGGKGIARDLRRTDGPPIKASRVDKKRERQTPASCESHLAASHSPTFGKIIAKYDVHKGTFARWLVVSSSVPKKPTDYRAKPNSLWETAIETLLTVLVRLDNISSLVPSGSISADVNFDEAAIPVLQRHEEWVNELLLRYPEESPLALHLSRVQDFFIRIAGLLNCIDWAVAGGCLDDAESLLTISANATERASHLMNWLWQHYKYTLLAAIADSEAAAYQLEEEANNQLRRRIHTKICEALERNGGELRKREIATKVKILRKNGNHKAGKLEEILEAMAQEGWISWDPATKVCTLISMPPTGADDE